MKTLFRIFVVLFVLLLTALAAGYLTLTNAGFQKRLVERKLPSGSSIETIHVTMNQLTMSGLVLMLEDGTRVEVGAVNTTFDPLSAVFDQTIKTGILQVQGVSVHLSEGEKAMGTDGLQTRLDEPSLELASVPASTTEASPYPVALLNDLGYSKWLFDIDGIEFDGVIHDGQGSQFIVHMNAPAIRPGASSNIDASLQLLTDKPLPSGLKAFDSAAQLNFKQKQSGGFESLQLEFKTSGTDRHGQHLISIQQQLELEVDEKAKMATLSVTFDADLPKPQVLAEELANFGALKVAGNAVVSTDGTAITLSAADLSISVSDVEVLTLDQTQSMSFGGAQGLSGDFLELSIADLPLEWLNPWFGPDLQLHSESSLSLGLSVVGTEDGAYMITFAEPVAFGPLTVTDGQGPLLENVAVVIAPELQWDGDQSFTYSLHSLSVADQYGPFIQGSSKGRIQLGAVRDVMNPFAGLQLQAALQVGLQELFQLPLLADRASIIGGQLALDVTIDDSADDPLLVSVELKELRARSLPSSTRDYTVGLGVAPTLNRGEWQIGADFLAGPASRPSTALGFSGVINGDHKPLTFSANISGPRVAQEDLSILVAACSPPEEAMMSFSRTSDHGASPQPSEPEGDLGPVAPAWAMLDGNASVQVDELRLESGLVVEAIVLEATVSEPRLRVDPFSAKIGEGAIVGSAAVLYASSRVKPYTLSTDIRLTDINPAMFVKQHQTPPVQGLFDGVFEMTGVGETLNAAVEDSAASLKVTGEEGILTAFELDNRKQVGLGLVGLLGQHLDRPGVSALSQTIPYFKDIIYDQFVFELTRGVDKRVLIPQLRLTGDSILLDASGSIGASGLSELIYQPLDLTVSLGAKGRLTDYLETLQLLQSTTSEDGYRRWNQDVHIAGSLDDPNTGELMDILNAAAKSAFSKPKNQTRPPEEVDPNSRLLGEFVPQEEAATELVPDAPKKQSKDERRREDIEMGLDLLNSLLGN
jgi:hypothetical protein